MTEPGPDGAERVGALLDALGVELRGTAPGAWQLTLECAGLPLRVDVVVRGPLLRIGAGVLPAGLIDPHQLLYWNGQAPLISFSEDATGEILVGGELSLGGLDPDLLDRCLGLVLASATRAREFAITHSSPVTVPSPTAHRCPPPPLPSGA